MQRLLLTVASVLVAVAMIAPSAGAWPVPITLTLSLSDEYLTTTYYHGSWVEGYVGQIDAYHGADWYGPLYCIQLGRDIYPGTNDFLLSPTDLIWTGADAAMGARVAGLYNRYAPGINGSGDGARGAGLQFAMWELIYDYGALDLDTGNFQYYDEGSYTDYSADARDWAETYLGDGATGVAGYYADGQDLIGPIPEPGTLLLLGAGLLGAGALAWRKRRS
jgi:hypothetical protein